MLNDEDKSDNDGLTDYSLEKFLENAFDLTPYYKGTDTKLLSQMWETVYRQKSDFNVRDYGCVTPRELISKFDKKFKLSDDGKSQRTIFVEKIETKEDGNRKNGIIKRRIKNYRIICADDGSGDYFFYMPEINKNFKGEILEKGTKVNFQVIKKPNDSENLENENGRATDVKVIK